MTIRFYISHHKYSFSIKSLILYQPHESFYYQYFHPTNDFRYKHFKVNLTSISNFNQIYNKFICLTVFLFLLRSLSISLSLSLLFIFLPISLNHFFSFLLLLSFFLSFSLSLSFFHSLDLQSKYLQMSYVPISLFLLRSVLLSLLLSLSFSPSLSLSISLSFSVSLSLDLHLNIFKCFYYLSFCPSV